ncbi:peptidylprolyl isomerase [Cryobacterium melibiosiphilum]|uniref:peptidylprolyl isomerase n=1 Tax=Cryobacterium melibiosiphilum TaxID=995039 RepID=A0A3A5MHD5_9MICO|nr:FKBP-type peptidyl-prolyl cis-trans isomerase [Cryobacterium melibiosiphilum]RJT84801.1 peptidylprolyl isomerase [Cryobacterium melibiosiphilum]
MPKLALKISAIATILGVALVLTGCTSDTESTDTTTNAAANASTEECTESGSASDSIDVTGDFGAEPVVSFESPLTATDTERTVTIAGTGTEEASTHRLVEVSLIGFSATTGEPIITSGWDDTATSAYINVDETQELEGLARAVNCAVVGDRVTVVIPPADAFGTAGQTDLGITADDSMVFVMDVKSIVPQTATGTDEAAVDGLPTVELAEDGAPSITIPDAEAPTDLKIETLKTGDGAVVASGDTVALEYTGVLWKNGEEFDSSWANAGLVQFPTTGVVEGFGAAMVGQTVGSQVLAVIPPDQGYGEAGSGDLISATDTLVFVLDIVAVTYPAATTE